MIQNVSNTQKSFSRKKLKKVFVTAKLEKVPKQNARVFTSTRIENVLFFSPPARPDEIVLPSSIQRVQSLL